MAEEVLRDAGRRVHLRALVGSAALATTLKAYPDARLLTVPKFAASHPSDLKAILNMLYVLLGLAVLVSLFGMVNTLALAVCERTREIELLRAIA